MPSVQQARLKYANHYLKILKRADDLYQHSGTELMSGLALFDQERPQIDQVRIWLQVGSSASLDRDFSIDFGVALSRLGFLRYDKRNELIPWLESLLSPDNPYNADILTELGAAYTDIGENKKAIELLEKAISAKQHRATSGRWDSNRPTTYRAPWLDAFNNLGTAYLAQGDIPNARRMFERCLDLSETGNRVDKARALGNLGLIYKSFNQYDRALEFHRESLTLWQEENAPEGVGFSHGHIGSILYLQGDYHQALPHFQEQLKMAQNLTHQDMESTAWGSLGLVYTAIGLSKNAQGSYQKALRLQRETGNKSDEGTTLLNLGHFHIMHREMDDARKYFEACLCLAREIGDKRLEASVCWNLGNLATETDDWEQAIEYISTSVAYEQSIQHPDTRRHAQYLEFLRGKREWQQKKERLSQMFRSFFQKFSPKPKAVKAVYVMRGYAGDDFPRYALNQLYEDALGHLKENAAFSRLFAQAKEREVPFTDWPAPVGFTDNQRFTMVLLTIFRENLVQEGIQLTLKQKIEQTPGLDKTLFITGGSINGSMGPARWGVQVYFQLVDEE
jgi:tetratricopeptide (TPR) repeat protein